MVNGVREDQNWVEKYFNPYWSKNKPMKVTKKLKNKLLLGLSGRAGKWRGNLRP